MKRKTALLLFVLAGAAAQQNSGWDKPVQYFRSAPAAQQHCPNDTVVWLNTRSGIYHFQGERWYGRTKDGAYICRKDADRMGDRATRNGQ